ncbi:acyltransferase family protein [Achromobacter xylosoxidans]|uniref:acyltransferase family protein n=1 Tax=Alcaligenes xylosoxydans xylosoxydans TaxID=85698 RepID=UPI0038FC4B71
MIKYRPDIDGLRALAVLPVVLFHADIGSFHGGFVGVDIFFVISGYLITLLLLQDFSAQRFSLRHFYVRRVRRIFPALLTVVAFTLVASVFLLLPGELSELGRATQRVAYFFSNHLFWHTQNDYWQQNSLSNQPLLHTWSLAVEEQFYVIVPAVLALCFWLGRHSDRQHHGRDATLWALLLLSLGLSQWALTRDPAGAFYTLPTRAWELLLGGLLASSTERGRGIPRNAIATELAGTTGLALILWSVFTYTDKTNFPGLNALPPCLGALLIIYAGANPAGSWVNRLLRTRVLVFVGLISYSLYLWHWPLLVLMRSTGWFAWGLPALPAWLLLSVILLVSAASWRWIERPFRKTDGNARVERRTLGWALFLLALCWALGYGTQRIADVGRPFAQPLPQAVIELGSDTLSTPGARCEGNPSLQVIHDGKSGCRLGETNAGMPVFAVLRDSHARMWTPAFDTLGHERNQLGIGLTYSSCVPLMDAVPPTRNECVDITDAAIDYLVRSPIEHIAIAGYWTDAAETITTLRNNPQDPAHSLFYIGLDRTLARLIAAGKKVYLLRDVPELPTNRTPYAKVVQSLREGGAPVFGPSLSEHRLRQRAVDADIDSLQQKYPFTILDPAPSLCSNDGCLVADRGRTLYRDKHHLTDSGAKRIREVLLPVFPSRP